MPRKTPAKPANPADKPPNEKPVVLLPGDNPQIPKADGNPPVQAYIAATRVRIRCRYSWQRGGPGQLRQRTDDAAHFLRDRQTGGFWPQGNDSGP